MAATFSSDGPSDSYVWIATSDGSWGTADNWQDVTTGDNPATSVPGGSDSVTFVSDPNTYLTVTGPGSAASLQVNGAIRLAGTFTTDTFEVATTGDSASLDILGGGMVSVGTSFAVGDNSYSGTITIEPAGMLAMSGTGSILVGGDATSSGAITVTGSQALLDAAASLILGNAGTGALVVLQGATARVGGLSLARLSGAVGSATIDGSGSVLLVTQASAGAVIGTNGSAPASSSATAAASAMRAGSAWASAPVAVARSTSAPAAWSASAPI